MFSTKGIGIMAILTTVLLGAIVAIQVIEFQLYRAEPTVWAAPRP